MAELKGTNIASGIVPFTDLDKYPTHYSKYGKGGYMTVETVDERNSIPEERREVGMLCYVINDETNIHTYRLGKDLLWEGVPQAGIPIYSSEELDKYGVPADGKYLFIPSENDLSGEIETNTITTSINGSYLDILFNTIRQLQTEVAKIRNSFRYGLYSYTGTDTAMSGIVNEIPEPEDEPLWAVDPDMLSLITGADVSISEDVNNLEPKNNLLFTENKFVINEEGVDWFDKDNLVKDTQDSKIFIYFTVSHLNIKLTLEDLVENTELEIDLSRLNANIVDLEKYKVLVILSRKTGEEGKETGKNYIWISINNPETNVALVEGYLNIISYSLLNNLVTVDKKYTVKQIKFTNLNLYQLDFYSKYQEFTQEVIPSIPSEQDYMYRVAHLTIRSVTNKDVLDSIKELLPENELIFVEQGKKLYIKNKGNVTAITGSSGSSGSNDDNDNNNNMTPQQLIEELKKLGIVYTDNNGLQLNSIADVTFVHQATGKQFKFEVDAEGELRSSELPKIDKLLSSRITNLKNTAGEIRTDKQYRGFVAKLHCGEAAISSSNKNDVKINSDRVKIGAVYMPIKTDTTFGCSHAFIELENTSDKDFPLNGCYLHYIHPNKENSNQTDIEHLALEGVLRAGSTFLIRGKQYSDPNINSDTYINVDDFDMEWYIGSDLIDLTVDTSEEKPYGFALTYGNDENIGIEGSNVVEISPSTVLVTSNSDSNTVKKASRLYVWYFIDSLPINGHISPTNKTWGQNVIKPVSNSIIKNTFELDPAKQAFQALNTYDSSRERLANTGNDVQILNLDKETISFPHSEEEYPIKRFTPKASKYKKNVSTDKTEFDQEKPNAVTCAFGIDVYKTRCFNWVSGGEFDEYVWIKKNGESDWKRFESYKKISTETTQSTSYPNRKEFSVEINNTIYARLVGNFPGCNIHYTSHKCIVNLVDTSVTQPTEYTYIVGRADKLGNPDPQHSSEEYRFTLYPNTYKPKIYLTTDQQGFHWIEYQAWTAAANFISEKIDNEIRQSNTTENKVFPVLLNSGDMTQNGTRVNEWLDYFNGGKSLLNHLEHMAVVGNNDLCGPNPEILGTGDDSGKSNAFYFHVFFCYEIDTTGNIPTPICNGKYIPSLYYFDTNDYRFIMANSEITFATCKSWYGLDKSIDGYNRVSNIYTGYIVKEVADDNIGNNNFDNSFTSIYTMMWKMLNSKGNKKPIITCHEMPFTVITIDCIASDTINISRSVSGSSLVGCHMNQLNTMDNKGIYWFSRLCEYFNVRLVLGGHKHTYAATQPVREFYYYTVNEKLTIDRTDNVIINSATNTVISNIEENKFTIDSIEYAIGDEEISGNGKSYTITGYEVELPINKNSKDYGPMIMGETLENDASIWYVNINGTNTHLSKFPLLYNYEETTRYPNGDNDQSSFFPFTKEEHIDGEDPYKNNRVVYFMCQATGYKQTSNKELPTNYQSFSSLIPKTSRVNGKDSADNQQKYPMLLVIDLNNNTWDITLERICNIMSNNYKFNQTTYGKNTMKSQSAVLLRGGGKFCAWVKIDEAIDLSEYSDNFSNLDQDTINRLAVTGSLYKLGNTYAYCESGKTETVLQCTLDLVNKKIHTDNTSYDINDDNCFSIDNVVYTINTETNTVTGSNGTNANIIENKFSLSIIKNAVIKEVISTNTLNIEL